jgi:two-component system repressor protein LuxO
MTSKDLVKRVAVIDDDSDFQTIAKWHLKKFGFEAVSIETYDALQDAMKASAPSVILLDWQFGEIDGTTLIESLRNDYPGSAIVFTTAHATPEVAALSIQLGAFDFITKPLEESRFELTMTRAQEHSELLNRIIAAQTSYEESEFEGMIATSPQMRTIFTAIQNVAQTDASVMVSGESGVGKELVATAIHSQSARVNRPFVPLNMASLPDTLVESQLFGHEKGAFTGAEQAHLGSVRQADSGTLFLDEMTEMPIQLQAKLLRFLQEGTFRPLGAKQDFDSDVRIVSSTNRDPRTAISEGLLRQDLYYRLNVIPIEVPPLRERDGDIALLAIHFLRQFSRVHSKDFIEITPNALHALEQYPWPGNVRELSHTIQRIVIMNSGNEVKIDHIPNEIRNFRNQINVRDTENSDQDSCEADDSAQSQTSARSNTTEPVIPLAEVEQNAIEAALAACGGVAYEAAEALGISRATIYRKIKLYKIDQDEMPDELDT